MTPTKYTTWLAALGILMLTGCATHNTANASRAQFLSDVWVTPAIRGKAPSELYSQVYFAPTTVTHLKEQGWWRSQSTKTQGQVEADAQGLADRMHHALVSAAFHSPYARLHVVSHPGPGTLVVETAITELVPAKAFWNATASAAGFVGPGAGLLGAAGRGSVTLEGRLELGPVHRNYAHLEHLRRGQTVFVEQWPATLR